ncbi:LamG-like jellyroll fold domain-containing protein [Paludibacterium yongneupense]|uniref:LamG-like jellyroll fold domain-containing protein n=1 Tax=Paludibacterium yongneupense TaxID=400061 RepID=UPI00040187F9|nr:LamG-like jellyroll fold domain-containing protein [Paludibacterium yongneupense]
MQLISSSDNLFHDGDPTSGALGTFLAAAWHNAVQGEIAAPILAAGLTLDPNNNAQLLAAILLLIESKTGNYSLDTGAVNAYVIALNPAINAYGNGLAIKYRAAHANTGPSTVNAGGGAVPLLRDDGQPLQSGDLPANAVVSATYDTTSAAFLVNSVVASQFDAILQAGGPTFTLDTGAANAYVGAYAPALQTRGEGMVLRVKIKTSNTGPSTFNDGLGAVTVVGLAHQALQGGELVAGGDAWFQWNSTVGTGSYVLLHCTGAPTQLASATQPQHAVTLGQIQTAIQENLYSAATAGGTGDALTGNFTPAISAATMAAGVVEVTVRALSPNATTTPTFTPNPGVIAPAAIVKGAGAALAPGDIAGAGHWVTLQLDATLGKWVLLNPATGIAPAVNPQVRQTVQAGATDSNGRPACITVGAGLQPQLLATVIAVRLAFALGTSDYIETISADTPWPALPANSLAYLYAQRANAGVVTLGSTLAPPQYGYSYNQAAQLLLHFDGANGATATTDDFGNPVALYGAAQLDTSVSKFGTSSLKLNGTTDYAKIPSITALPNGSWSIRGWFNPTSVTGTQTFFNLVNAAGFGLSLEMSSAKTFLYLSSTGASWDLANGTAGTTALSIGNQYFIEITFDAVAGKYFIYVNGALDQTISSSAKICAAPIGFTIGAVTYSAANTFFAGHVDEVELLPYCDHPAGTAYAVPAAVKSVVTAGYASDWYSIGEGILYKVAGPSAVSGGNPVLLGAARLYIGEGIAGAASISSVTAYAYNGRYDSGLFAAAAGTAYSKSHNVGTTQYNCDVTMADDAAGSNERKATDYYYTGSIQIGYIGYAPTSRNVYSLYTGAGGVGTGSSGGTAASGYYRLRVRRAF